MVGHPALQRRPIRPGYYNIADHAQPAGRVPWAYDQFQAQPAFIAPIDQMLGYKLPMAMDFITTADMVSMYSSLTNIINAWGNKGRRLVLSMADAYDRVGDTGAFGGSQFVGVVAGTSNRTSVLNGKLDHVWDRLAGAGAQPSLKDLIIRGPCGWEFTATYFPWQANNKDAVKQFRLSWRYIIDRVKRADQTTANQVGGTVNANRGLTAGFEVFFNPECGGANGIPAASYWPGTVVFGGSGTASAPTLVDGANGTGLLNDWYTWTQTPSGTVTCYKKEGTTEADAAWVLKAGVTDPISQLDFSVGGEGYSPYLDANGNRYKYVDYCGSEAYSSNYAVANNTLELYFNNRVLGYADGLGIPFRANAIGDGVEFWRLHALQRKVKWAIGEWGSGTKVDFPTDGNSMSVMRKSGMGGPLDNPYHTTRMFDHMEANGCAFHCLWDVDAPDFMAKFSQSKRITGLDEPNKRTRKPLQAGVVVRRLGSPERVAAINSDGFDESNVAPGVPTVTWVGTSVLNAPMSAVVGTASIPNAGAAKRVTYCTYGSDGSGYGQLAFQDGLLDDFSGDNQLRMGTRLLNGPYSFYLRAQNDAGFSDALINFTVQNTTATFGQLTLTDDIAQTAGTLTLVPITVPAQQQALVTNLEFKVGTGAVSTDKFRPVVYSRNGTTIGGRVWMGGEQSVGSAGSTKSVGVGNIGFYPLTPGNDYYIGAWVQSTSALKGDAAGTGKTATTTTKDAGPAYSSSQDPIVSAPVDTVGAIYCKATFQY